MDKRIDKIKKLRQFLIAQIVNLTEEQLNKIPGGYNNNIIWNLIHLISIQQGLCYSRAAQRIVVPDKFIAQFSTNTKPERTIESKEIEEVKSLVISSIDKLQEDYESKIFQNYTPSPNIFKIYGIEVKGIDDALELLLYHDGCHTGYILSLKKFVG